MKRFQALTHEPLNLHLGEGAQTSPVDGKIYFLNILVRPEEAAKDKKPGIFRFHPSDLDTNGILPDDKLEFCPISGASIGCLGFTSEENVLVAGIDQNLVLINFNTSATHILASAHNDKQGARFNDGDTSPDGRYFFIGTKGRPIVGGIEPSGNLYAYAAETGAMHSILQDIQISNGLGWSPDGKKFYYIDTRIDCEHVPIKQFQYNTDASRAIDILSCGSVFALTAGPGKPDGLKVDQAGNLYVAFFGGGHLRRYTPDGTLLDILPVLENGQTTIPVLFKHTDMQNCMLVMTAAEDIAVSDLPNQYWGTPFIAIGLPEEWNVKPASVLKISSQVIKRVL